MAQCIKPIKIVNPRYIKLAGSKAQAFRDFGLKPDLYLIVPCGRCLHCLKRRGVEWRRRLLDEYRYMPAAARQKVRFVTLTVAPKFYRDFVERPKYYIRLFLDRYRKRFGHSPRHWIINEYGDDPKRSRRLHFHALFFDNEVLRADLEAVWQYGIVRSSRLRSSAAISYITTYVTKFINKWIIDKDEKQFILCSPGIGKAYTLDPANLRWHHAGGQLRCYRLDFGGRLCAIPRYYRQKIFSSFDLLRIRLRYLASLSELPDTFSLGKRVFTSFWTYAKACFEVGGCPLLLDQQWYILFYGKKQDSRLAAC